MMMENPGNCRKAVGSSQKQDLERMLLWSRYPVDCRAGVMYSDAAKRVADSAGIVKKRLHQEIFVRVDYQFFGLSQAGAGDGWGMIQDIR